MTVKSKNEGTKIPYEISGTRITFDDDLSLNLAKKQRDWDVHIDICSDGDGSLCTGTGLYYVAEIDIPAAVYEDEDPTQSIPLDMDDVTLTLWSVERRQ